MVCHVGTAAHRVHVTQVKQLLGSSVLRNAPEQCAVLHLFTTSSATCAVKYGGETVRFAVMEEVIIMREHIATRAKQNDKV